MFEKYKIIKKMDAHIDECISKNIYTIFGSNYAKNIFAKKLSVDRLTFFYDLFKEWDNQIAVPKEIGEYLESLINDEKLIIGIHRTRISSDFENDITMKGIIQNGLRNYGDLSSGAVSDNPNLSKTVSFPGNLLNLMILLKSTYKGSTGGFVLAFPSEIIDDEGTITTENSKLIYDKINNVSHIKPEYIIGYVDNSYGVMNFYSKEELLKHFKKDDALGAVEVK